MTHEEQIRVLQSIERSLTNLQKTLQKLVEAVADNTQTKDGAKQEHTQVDAAVVSLPVEITEYYGSEQSERGIKNNREHIRIGLEIAGVVIAVLLLVVTKTVVDTGTTSFLTC